MEELSESQKRLLDLSSQIENASYKMDIPYAGKVVGNSGNCSSGGGSCGGGSGGSCGSCGGGGGCGSYSLRKK